MYRIQVADARAICRVSVALPRRSLCVCVNETSLIVVKSWEHYLSLSHIALFQDLGHNLCRVLCAKLILEEAVGGAVECALSSVTGHDVISDWTRMAARSDNVTYG